MNRKRAVVLALFLAALAAAAVVFEPWAFFRTDTVEEAFPVPDMTEAQQAAFAALPDPMQETLKAMAADPEMDQDMVAQTTLAVIQPDDAMDEEPMEGMEQETTVLGTGSFGQIDPIHGASGTATLYVLPDGRRIVRLEDFRSTNGPELHVILTAGTEASTFADVGDYVDLGLLKGNVGNQNYDIPADTDLDAIRSVVIYCRPFRVVFSVANLT